MITLSSSVPSNWWAIISFFSATVFLLFAIAILIKMKKVYTPPKIRILIFNGLLSISLAIYSVSIANYLIDKDYSVYFILSAGVFLIIFFIFVAIAKSIAKKKL